MSLATAIMAQPYFRIIVLSAVNAKTAHCGLYKPILATFTVGQIVNITKRLKNVSVLLDMVK
jgi:hypothetical protein